MWSSLTGWEALYACVLLIKERSAMMGEGQVSMLNENCNSATSQPSLKMQ